ncbi:hypothetical protein TRFO_04485 [Tritrichomonas foetus]|uniref:Uncharacterized protein n=1 Tax=Tritrichomonas foetus TaxID=1144522 RepID=A0A1J4KFG3_9EUKA|nr:hypothetical protein TRFO_04485 [Tritrichomonas foetus]|eukprot:OHT09923.1 hypothetical protein TRFO_04485 [Tritrichomonas foetus]
MMELINKLGLTANDLKKFPKPKAIYTDFRRTVVYDIDREQMNILKSIISFQKARNLTEEKQQLIMFLENDRPTFQGSCYLEIFFKIAIEVKRQNKKLSIPYRPFTKASRMKNSEIVQFDFLKGINEADNSNESDQYYEEDDQDYEEDEDVEYLVQKFKLL